MKKVLTTAAALGLVLGIAATASAMDFSVSGYYRIDGRMISDARNNGTGGVAFTDPSAAALLAQTTTDTTTNSWIEHDFRLYPVLKVNDSITMKADVRLRSDTLWDDATQSATAITANKIYMEYNSPIGMWTLGAQPAGAWGTPFLDSAGTGHRIKFSPNAIAKPWSLTLFAQKGLERQGPAANTTASGDSDTYYAGIGHSGDYGSITAAYVTTVTGGAAGTVDNAVGQNVWFTGTFPVGPVTLITEIQHMGGDSTTVNAAGTGFVDKDSLAGMLLVTGKVSDNITAGAVYFMAEGEDTAGDDTNFMGANGLGFDWEPLYIMTGDDMGALNGDSIGTPATFQNAGVEAFGAFADLTVNPKMTLHAAIGSGKAETTDNMAVGCDDDYGWEFDLGLSYKLLDNLTYDLHFGYWEVGDFIKNANAATDPAEITVITNHLTMKF